MREIKFRGKDDKGNWVYGYPIIVLYKAWIKDISDTTTNPRRLGRDFADFRCVEVEKETVGQYTGLKDKNGKEIYEGDIIRTHFSFSHEVVQEPFIIQWNKDKAMFEGVKQNPEQNEYLRSFSFFPEQRFIYEVIGNIHENPELLEVQA